MASSRPHTARLHHQRARRDSATGPAQASADAACCGSFIAFIDAQLEHVETCSAAEATRGHCACVHAVQEKPKLADPGIATEPKAPTETQSRPANIFAAAPVQGRSAALDVCVASSNAAAARGYAAQAASDRKILHDRRKNLDLRNQGIVYRQLLWTVDGRPHQQSPEPYNTQQIFAACRKSQQRSATPLKHRWKHGIQIAFLRRRAAMTRAVLSHTSARAKWLLAGLRDRVANHWIRAPPLDGQDDDEDGDARTDTTVTTMTNLASFTSQDLKPVTVAREPLLELSALSGARRPRRRPRRMRGRYH